jgi:hypothetical protein
VSAEEDHDHIEELLDMLTSDGLALEDAEALVNGALNQHAHALAEKIRADELCKKPAHRDYFADLIDPEVAK